MDMPRHFDVVFDVRVLDLKLSIVALQRDARQDLNSEVQTVKLHPNYTNLTHKNRNMIYSSLGKFHANMTNGNRDIIYITKIPCMKRTTQQYDIKLPQYNPK